MLPICYVWVPIVSCHQISGAEELAEGERSRTRLGLATLRDCCATGIAELADD